MGLARAARSPQLMKAVVAQLASLSTFQKIVDASRPPNFVCTTSLYQ